MVKRLSVYLLVFGLIVSFSLFLNACSKKALREGIEKKEEAAKAEEKVKEELKGEPKEETKVSQPLKSEETDKAATEAQLREEELKKQREREEAARKEEAAIKEDAAKREAAVREEFENTDIHFDFDKFSLTNQAREILAKKVSWLQGHTDLKIKIEGHCDERGSNEYNMALGERRSNSAMQYLVTAGVEAARVSTISYGEEKPLDPGHDEDAWAKNRRAHFKIE
ncbi:MAG: peptidoglycan-associated lipoprotein Pal [Desulfobacterales bacterium]|nr:peptidoglycan-associated lipoprotein Pal [Desulfobacterales bacterium]